MKKIEIEEHGDGRLTGMMEFDNGDSIGLVYMPPDIGGFTFEDEVLNMTKNLLERAKDKTNK